MPAQVAAHEYGLYGMVPVVGQMDAVLANFFAA